MHLPAQIPNICSLCVRVNYYQEKGIGKGLVSNIFDIGSIVYDTNFKDIVLW